MDQSVTRPSAEMDTRLSPRSLPLRTHLTCQMVPVCWPPDTVDFRMGELPCLRTSKRASAPSVCPTANREGWLEEKSTEETPALSILKMRSGYTGFFRDQQQTDPCLATFVLLPAGRGPRARQGGRGVSGCGEGRVWPVGCCAGAWRTDGRMEDTLALAAAEVANSPQR